MTSSLETVLDDISGLKGHLYKHMMLIRELDERSQELMERIDTDSKDHLTSVQRTSRKKRMRASDVECTLESIRDAQGELMALSDEKVDIAKQAYDLVDRSIRKLDEELDNFEGSYIRAENESAEGSAAAVQYVPADIGGGTDVLSAQRPVASVLEMPVQEHEPVYCFCQRVSYGSMVACDDENCPYEWFHLECLGLKVPPKGKWFCPECRQRRKKK